MLSRPQDLKVPGDAFQQAVMNSPRGEWGSIYFANVITQELVEMRAVVKKIEVATKNSDLPLEKNGARTPSNTSTTGLESPKVVTPKLSLGDIERFLQEISSFRKH